MATTYKVHPAIGIARVGDSPAEFFVGPERIGERPEPAGGFKDDQCRVKRQAARFRIFAHHDDGSVTEVTDADARISWTVHLANSKAAFVNRGNPEPAADLVIDPGARTVSGPGGHAELTGGTIAFAGAPRTTVPLGEVRTDDAGRLLVLGGHGRAASPVGRAIVNFWANPGWYDDVSDGQVSATIVLRDSGETPPVAPAWAIVGPPKFAPGLDSTTTLWDRLRQRMVELGLLAAPTTTSYTADVHPILRRARDMRWVEAVLRAHNWPAPVTEQALIDAICARLRPKGDMPDLRGEDSALTAVQHAHLLRWQKGDYTADWAGEPAPATEITPDGLDRAALEACVGGAFFPGIEAGGLPATGVPILEAAYAEPFRLAAGLAPGALSAALALPWQADFNACADNWWPVPRPNDVLTEAGSGIAVRWDRDIGSQEDMVANWHRLGFVVRDGDDHVEVDHCDEASVALRTPHLSFTDVPLGPLGAVGEQALAIEFEVISPSAELTVEYAPGGSPANAQLVAASISATVGPTAPNEVATARLWLVYRTGTEAAALPTQTLTVREPVSGQTWQITVDGNTVARPATATALVLDGSAPMGAGTRQAALRQVAHLLTDLLPPGDGLGIVGDDQDARVLGDGGPSRAAIHELIDGRTPGDETSIGAGLARGQELTTAAPFANRAIVVVCGTRENQARPLAEVAAELDVRTHAVGIGAPQQLSVPALRAVTGNTGGVLAVTGQAHATAPLAALTVLSAVTGTEVVTELAGAVAAGAVHQLPFQLCDTDAAIEVILLTERPAEIDFRLRTPNGLLLEPWRARAEPAMRFELGVGLAYFRLALPAQLRTARFDQAGAWHVLLTPGEPRLEPGEDDDGVDRSILAASSTGTGAALPYTVAVHAYSAVSLRAAARPASTEPGSAVTVTATLTESGLPVGGEPFVWLELTAPDGTVTSTPLEPRAGARFTTTFPTGTAGVYLARVRCRGRTRRALPFRRERTLTVPVWHQ
ncbi:LodA/GoxA family CTQ-dependent oxidase [Actinophytocola sediminis]